MADEIVRREPVEIQASSDSAFDLPPESFKALLERRSENRKLLIEWIRKDFIEGQDWGKIEIKGKPSKPSLWKSGAEKILGKMGWTAEWPNAEMYEKAAAEGVQVKEVILQCRIRAANGREIATGLGATSVAKHYGDLNKAIKMAKKSSLIDGVILAGGLGSEVTQDLEDADPKDPGWKFGENAGRKMREFLDSGESPEPPKTEESKSEEVLEAPVKCSSCGSKMVMGFDSKNQVYYWCVRSAEAFQKVRAMRAEIHKSGSVELQEQVDKMAQEAKDLSKQHDFKRPRKVKVAHGE